MKKENPNPLALDEMNALEITDKVKSFVNELSSDIDTETTNRAFWEKNIEKYRNLRYGIRNKKTFPWKNCANYIIPLIDADITRIKPAYVNLAYGVTPIVTFEGYGPEDMEPSRKREILFDWRMRTQVKFFDQYCYGIDKMLEQGAVVYKTIWRYETASYTETLELAELEQPMIEAIYDERVTDDMLFHVIKEELDIDVTLQSNVDEILKVVDKFREGEVKFKLKLQEIKVDRPQLIARDLKDDIVIPIDTLILEDNLDNARFIDDKIWMSKNDIKIAMRDEKYESYLDSEIDSWANKSPKNGRKNTATMLEDDMVLLHETCVWLDINDDGIKERCIVTWPDSAPERVLRFIEMPYDHGQWPYTLVKREYNDPGVYSSRGIPALDEDFQVGISTSFNQAIDNGTIVNTPTVVMKRNSVTNVRNQRYVPGNVVETNGPITDYEIRQNVNLSQGTLFQQAQLLKNWANQRLGNTTSGISDSTNLQGMGTGGKKTKAEIDLISTLHGETQSLDLQIFQQQMARVYYQIDALYEQFGSDEAEIQITGEEPIKISRKEIQGRFNIVPNGRLDNTNPMLRAQKSFKLLELFMNDPDIRHYELKKIFLDDYDMRISSRILLTQEERMQMQEENAKQEAEIKRMLLSENVEMQEITDALSLRKEMGIEAIHGKRYAEG